jgi:hypothetical protein
MSGIALWTRVGETYWVFGDNDEVLYEGPSRSEALAVSMPLIYGLPRDDWSWCRVQFPGDAPLEGQMRLFRK